MIATAGVDRAIRVFDVRAPSQGPTTVLQGHDYAVRRISWSPHLADVLLSASYDMTCRVWTDGSNEGPGAAEDALMLHKGKEMGRMGNHTEFVTGVDWCMFGAEGWCASTGWDSRLLVWDVRTVMSR